MEVNTGRFTSFGAAPEEGGYSFTFDAKGAASCEILLLGRGGQTKRVPVPESARCGDVCSVYIKEIPEEYDRYLYVLDGRRVCDPYAPLVSGRDQWMDASREKNAYETEGRFRLHPYRWRHRAPKLRAEDLSIFKLHLRGFTMQSRLKDEECGSYKGVIRRLKNVADMGFTAVEFMPLYDFEELLWTEKASMNAAGEREVTREATGKTNYWGYGNACYLAPKASYFGGETADLGMKKLVDTAHGLGMEFYMEICYAPEVSDDLFCEALRRWVREYRVDGFHLVGMGLPAERIATDPYLAATRLFYDGFDDALLSAEREDKRLFVYNPDFLFALRKLQNHMDGDLPSFVVQMRRQNKAYGFVNYAANTNDFTLLDSFSYGEKHNEANGENNADGRNASFTCNYGVEGPTKNRAIRADRRRQVRLALAATMLSQAVPLLSFGDASYNTHEGNNNPYCQDNSLGWAAYSTGKEERALREYVHRLLTIRKQLPVLRSAKPMQMTDYARKGLPDLSYHGREPWVVAIGSERRAVSLFYCGDYVSDDAPDVLLLLNFHYEEEFFALPQLMHKRQWHYLGNSASFEPAVTGGSFDFAVPLTDQKEILCPGASISVLLGMPEAKK